MSSSMSGIKMDASVKEFYNKMNLKKLHKFVGFKLSDDKKTVIADDCMCGDKADTNCKEDDEVHFNKMKEMLTEDEPRYILYDFGFRGKEGGDVKKLAFIYWCSNNCPVKKRMVYASTKDDVKKTFTGLGIEFQANDLDDLVYGELMEEISKKIRN